MIINIDVPLNIRYPQHLGHDELEIECSRVNGEIEPYLRIKFFDQSTDILLNYEYADESGVIRIKDIDLTKHTFYIVTHDPKNEFNGVLLDNLGGRKNVDGDGKTSSATRRFSFT